LRKITSRGEGGGGVGREGPRYWPLNRNKKELGFVVRVWTGLLAIHDVCNIVIGDETSIYLRHWKESFKLSMDWRR